MFFLMLAALLTLLGGIFFYLYEKTEQDGAGAWGVVLWVVACIFLLVVAIGSPIAISKQKKSFEKYRAMQKQVTILENQANTIIAEMEVYLTQMYPDHELGVFKMMSGNDLTLYLAKYPQLKASDTFLAQGRTVLDLRQRVYDLQLRMTDKMADMRYATINPWTTYWWVPEIPDDLLASGDRTLKIQ